MFEFKLLKHFPLKFAFWWVLVPNIGAIAMWPIGGPSMAFPMAICGGLALLFCQFRSRIVRRVGIIFCFILSVLMYIAVSFNLGPLKAASSVKFVADIDFTKSPEYIVAITIIIFSLGLALRFAPSTPMLLRREERIMAIVAVALLINIDSVATAGARGTYKMNAPAGTPIDSAVLQNALTPKHIHSRNLIIILVESLGLPNNPHDRHLFNQAWGRQRWNSKYKVSQGKSAYFGSTTNGELRELCAVWSDYDSFDFDSSECLPEKFKKAGFNTTAIHAFSGDFFEREAWYPKLGFESRLFRHDLLVNNVKRCGGVFDGACDSDVPALIRQRLTNSRDRRNLVYWVTLNLGGSEYLGYFVMSLVAGAVFLTAFLIASTVESSVRSTRSPC